MFPKNFKISNYTIQFHIKSSEYAETYRVKGADDKLYFMKVLDCEKLKKFRFDQDNNIKEIELVKKLSHKNILSFKESGSVLFQDKGYKYIVHEYISGETIAQKLKREQFCSVYDAKIIINDLLSAVSYLHNKHIIHNELTIHNVMIDMSGQRMNNILIDFGYAQSVGKQEQPLDNRNLFYLAPECFNGEFSIQSDIYSIGAILYHLLFGLPPYFVNLPENISEETTFKFISNEQSKGLKTPVKNNIKTVYWKITFYTSALLIFT